MISRCPLPIRACSMAAWMALATLAAPVLAQTASTEANKAALSDAERAKRDAEKVFQWIKFHAEKSDKGDNRKTADAHDAKPVARPVAVKAPAPPTPAPAPSVRRVDPDVARAPAPMDHSAPPPPSVAAAVETPPAEVMAMAAPTASAPVTSIAPPPAPEPDPLPEEVDSPLRLVKKVDPEYPRMLLTQQRNGSVMVRFTVLPDGSVTGAEATKSPDRKLSAAAVNAVKQWRFDPVRSPRQVSVEIGFQYE